ncbi:MAG: hypothetical protein KBF92_07325, partial [Bacteroidia bacterium]|nr:hypothetical protein [Bacteroidia bacterium]
RMRRMNLRVRFLKCGEFNPDFKHEEHKFTKVHGIRVNAIPWTFVNLCSQCFLNCYLTKKSPAEAGLSLLIIHY